jgi:hypothetical protein
MLVNRGYPLGNRVLKESSVKLRSTNQVGDLFEGDEKGKSGSAGFGYIVAVTLDPDSAVIPRNKGPFDWAGVFNTILD